MSRPLKWGILEACTIIRFLWVWLKNWGYSSYQFSLHSDNYLILCLLGYWAHRMRPKWPQNNWRMRLPHCTKKIQHPHLYLDKRRFLVVVGLYCTKILAQTERYLLQIQLMKTSFPKKIFLLMHIIWQIRPLFPPVKMEYGWNFSISGPKIMVKSGLENIFLKFLHFLLNEFTS